MMYLNLTQHAATAEQAEAGVHDLPETTRETLVALLTFDDPPSPRVVAYRAARIADLAAEAMPEAVAEGDASAMIGGAPFLMASLEAALWTRKVMPFYAFSRRESVETTAPDGSVRKSAVFRHVRLIPAVCEATVDDFSAEPGVDSDAALAECVAAERAGFGVGGRG